MEYPQTCPICNAPLIAPIGPPDAKVLIVSEFPGEYETEQGRPFVPQAPAGRVLHAELYRVGVSIDALRLTNVWLHAPDEKDCRFSWHLYQAEQECKDRRIILVLGSTASIALLGVNVMSVSGTLVKSKKWPKTKMIVGPNPATCLHGPVGEFRLAIELFKKEYDKCPKT